MSHVRTSPLLSYAFLPPYVHQSDICFPVFSSLPLALARSTLPAPNQSNLTFMSDHFLPCNYYRDAVTLDPGIFSVSMCFVKTSYVCFCALRTRSMRIPLLPKAVPRNKARHTPQNLALWTTVTWPSDTQVRATYHIRTTAIKKI